MSKASLPDIKVRILFCRQLAGTADIIMAFTETWRGEGWTAPVMEGFAAFNLTGGGSCAPGWDCLLRPQEHCTIRIPC